MAQTAARAIEAAPHEATGAGAACDHDVVVVGAGFGGLYGVYRFRQMGLSVLGFEGGGGVGGVWYHNRYPGARVDVESYDYCYYFSQELYREWKWSEKYATQPELMRYLNHVADRFDIRRHFRFNTWVTGAQWNPDAGRYDVTTSTGLCVTARFLVMATGQLSAARKPEFEGLDRFKGEWVQTSHWPEREVKLAGRRVAVIGTGSSGVQTIPEVAKVAQHLYVFQRSPNFSVPAWNGPMDDSLWQEIRKDVPAEREGLYVHPGCSHIQRGLRPATDLSPQEQRELLEAAWARGGHGMGAIFSDQTVNKDTNDLVANFVRDKIRSIVKDPAVAEKLCPFDHPIGTRRLCVDTNYYATYNRDNVTLVDVREHPIRRLTETGIELSDGSHYAVDLIIFALGFHAFTAPLSNAGIRNEKGETPAGRWKRGPRTLLGITTAGFPNLFFPTGPGSPSVLANMAPQNEFHIDWIADCIDYMRKHGHRTVEPTVDGEGRWTAHVAEVSDKLLRRQVNNYMVHINEDGSRIFIPYVGGMDRFARQANEIAAKGYEGFSFA
ncbi:MAG TPA: NAD(P)/FAD-dependent oxidoreductase [Burkholderiales bacterium]|nr:NAD(P)/FAD-dependent oxidoreductase [Burkholderiales bacterium]